MRILHVYDLGPYASGTTVGGIENHILSLLSKLAEMGHKCYFLTGAIPGESQRESLKGIEVIRTDMLTLVKRFWNPCNLTFSRQIVFLLAGLKRRIQKNMQVDLIHGHVYSASIVAAAIASKQGIPCVNTLHGSYYGHWNEITSDILRPLLFSAAERILVPLLGKIGDFQIHTDYFFARKAVEWGISREKIRIILNAVDPDWFYPGTLPVELSVPKPRIVTIRRLVPKNGVHILVRAFLGVKKEFPAAQLIIVGDGPQKAQLRNLAENLKLSRSIHFIGRVSNSLVPRFLAAADVIVVPSLVEASSISLLEGMSMKKPCVATRIPGINLISDSNTVESCEPNDPQSLANAIKRILTDSQRADLLAENARKRVLEHHTINNMALAHENLYESLV